MPPGAEGMSLPRTQASDSEQRPARITVCDCDRPTRRDTELRDHAGRAVAGSPPQRPARGHGAQGPDASLGRGPVARREPGERRPARGHAHCPGAVRRRSAVFRCLARSARRRAAASAGSARLPRRHGGVGVDRAAAGRRERRAHRGLRRRAHLAPAHHRERPDLRRSGARRRARLVGDRLGRRRAGHLPVERDPRLPALGVEGPHGERARCATW